MSRRVLIIGDGLAGLATAFHLLNAGFEIQLASFRPARMPPALPSVPDDVHSYANGETAADRRHDIPVVVHGFHRETWSMLEALHGADVATRATPVQLEWLWPSQRPSALRPFPAPAPLHAVLGLLRFRGLSLPDRWRLLSHLERLWEGAAEEAADLEHQSASRWIARWGQSLEACQRVWDPLCRFLLDDPLSTASAASFQRALQQLFLAHRRNVHTVVFPSDARDLLLAPLWQRLRTHGVDRGPAEHRVAHLACDAHRVHGVVLQDGRTLVADSYVLALPPRPLLSLVPERLLSKFSSFSALQEIVSSPMAAIHVEASNIVVPPRLFLCPVPFSWTACHTRTVGSQPRTAMSCLTPQGCGIETQPDEMLVQRFLAMLRTCLADFDRTLLHGISEWQVTRSVRPSYSSRPGFSAIRPLQRSPLENAYLAGGWTETGLPPSSLESELTSARLCAAAVRDASNAAR